MVKNWLHSVAEFSYSTMTVWKMISNSENAPHIRWVECTCMRMIWVCFFRRCHVRMYNVHNKARSQPGWNVEKFNEFCITNVSNSSKNQTFTESIVNIPGNCYLAAINPIQTGALTHKCVHRAPWLLFLQCIVLLISWWHSKLLFELLFARYGMSV